MSLAQQLQGLWLRLLTGIRLQLPLDLIPALRLKSDHFDRNIGNSSSSSSSAIPAHYNLGTPSRLQRLTRDKTKTQDQHDKKRNLTPKGLYLNP